MAATDPTPSWEVTGQQETMDQGPGGSYVQGTKVTFRTASGAVGSVFVPQDQYTVDQVRRLVAERAATMDAVHGLRG